MVNQTGSEKVVEERKTSLKEEMNETRKEIFKLFGWHFLCKEISDYTKASFFEIMKTPAIEVAGLSALITQHSTYNNYGKETT